MLPAVPGVLTVLVVLPLVAAVLLLPSRVPDAVARWAWVGVATAELVLAGLAWAAYEDPGQGRLALEQQVPWIPGVRSSYHVGVDGLSLPLVLMTAVVFLACAVFALREQRRPRQQAALFCALEGVCVGLFVSADLVLFFCFFDLSIVLMYLSIALWGHGDAGRSALRFFLYTFLGSLALLLGFVGLYAAADPHTFDMVELAASPPLQGSAVGTWVLGAVLLGLAVKTPTFPFHTWLPPAHTDAPAVGSAVLAGVLLKMGTYGFVRVAMPMLPDAWRAWAPVVVVVGVVSVLWGALVALAQTDFKRMVAYTSVNHMGYVVLAVGAAGVVSPGDGAAADEARAVAVSGAVTQMVSHGLLTAALFLLAGVLWERRGDYTMARYGGLAGPAPRFAVLLAVAAVGSLGLPGLSGFVAELQVLAGSVAVVPASAVAVLGLLLVAAVLLIAVRQLLTGPAGPLTAGFADVGPRETLPVGLLLVLSVAIGLLPGPLLDVVEPAATAVAALVGR